MPSRERTRKLRQKYRKSRRQTWYGKDVLHNVNMMNGLYRSPESSLCDCKICRKQARKESTDGR